MPVHLVYNLDDAVTYGNKHPKGVCAIPASHAKALGAPIVGQIVHQARKIYPHLTINVFSDSVPFSIVLKKHNIRTKC